MKKLLVFSLLGIATIAAPWSALGQTVGVSIGINQPGVYGRIDIGRFPQPVLINERPVLIQPAPIALQRQPVYLYVPAPHQQNWARYCSQYGACGQPVYFVQESWVRERYVQEHPHWREAHDNRDGDKHEKRDKREKHEKHDRRDKHED